MGGGAGMLRYDRLMPLQHATGPEVVEGSTRTFGVHVASTTPQRAVSAKVLCTAAVVSRSAAP
jgi:hypothetical protein